MADNAEPTVPEPRLNPYFLGHEAAEKAYPDFCIVRAGSNLGFARACNVGLGLFRDNIDSLIAAIEYLAR